MIRILLILIFLLTNLLTAKVNNTYTICKDGSGDYTSITEAINNLPMFNYERKVLFVKNGVYEEKIRIECDYITLIGEHKDSVIIKYSQLREDWIKNKDSIGPAVINIHADDIVLDNLTVINTQPQIGPHAFTIYGTGTRTIITNCNVISKGGDTVSLWNYKEGMYYHSNCYFEGAVDFVCPRGWCYITNSKFYEVKKTAAIWHAGGFKESQKFVIKNSEFDGATDFYLGRHHYDAQFFLINCELSDKVIDKNIYRVTYDDTTRNRPFNWGERYFYKNIKKESEKYNWLNNNISDELEKEITSSWTFDNRWFPESDKELLPSNYKIVEDSLILDFDETVYIIGKPEIQVNKNIFYTYASGSGSTSLTFKQKDGEEIEQIKSMVKKGNGDILACKAGLKKRKFVKLN